MCKIFYKYLFGWHFVDIFMFNSVFIKDVYFSDENDDDVGCEDDDNDEYAFAKKLIHSLIPSFV